MEIKDKLWYWFYELLEWIESKIIKICKWVKYDLRYMFKRNKE